ncbi:SDR family NAD(P)-dependent oxidoreductase [Amycolatopsis acidiphila]|uniref:SDR family NAD(P)-dependent oxidoreductase n=1 Tax=Amycolatopsis acidiphila TaxID=715473 RepID=A0A557ZX69_9PSEU|nr:SDR family NAD(P)-dependent oxidoreductase [Amycolatopsis acidiphila]TVT16601.1 SDR family NAD(P)-dependent oxidoreductase [Amycolatopsis acidiphila]UIJ62049.1 SDR family NAD(P)-dependent oxidoreductase [Amycolatopsis acidiphila]GHG98958.1 hypothetical protein GCM10017788_79350 [Amycolatopsis acidiphila]
MDDPRKLESVLAERVAAATRGIDGLENVAVLVRGTVTRPSRSLPGDTAERLARTVDSSAPSSLLVGPALNLSGDEAGTLDEALRRAALLPDKGTVYLAGDEEPRFQSYRDLAESAGRVLGGLRARGVRPGDPVILQLRDNQDIVTVFWACVLGGFVATPIGVAPSYETHNEANRKLRNAWRLLGEPVIVADDGTAAELAAAARLWEAPGVRTLPLSELDTAEPAQWLPGGPDAPVLNLFTSGSTGTPKCVQHTHASIAARTWSAAQARGYTAEDVSLVWMPLDHITLAMFNVRDVFLRALHVNARTADFLADPLELLRWIDRYRVTNVLGSNFAYALVSEAHGDATDLRLDLSCVREFINAGEGVDPAVSHRFLRLIGRYGAPPDVMTPAWGMSETCSAVSHATQSRDDRSLGTVSVRRSSVGGDVVVAGPGDDDAVLLSTVGAPIGGVEMRIVDPGGAVLKSGQTGELQVRGVTMMRGYYGNPEAGALADAGDGWFRTGDLAFVHDGEVVIAGRIKDQIIVRGINFRAAELEAIVERVAGVRVPYAAAAAYLEPGAQGERLAVFFVPEDWEAGALDRTLTGIRSALSREAGIAPDLMVPVGAPDFPRTATGKIQRGTLVAGLREGRLRPRAERDGAEAPDSGQWLFTTTWSALDGGRAPAGPGTVFLGPRRLAEDCGLADPVLIDTTDDLAGALDRAARALGGVGTVVFAWPLWTDKTGPRLRAEWLSEELAAVLAVLDDGSPRVERLLVLTSGAVVTGDPVEADLGASVLSGLVRTAAAELDRVAVTQLDLPADRAGWRSALEAELAAPASPGEVVAHRDGQRLVRRLRPLPAEHRGGGVRAEGRYVVTGGLGGIGTRLCAHLLAEYRVKLLVLGRSEPAGERAARLAELRAAGDVRYRAVDVADADAVRAAVAKAEAAWGEPIDGIFHLAGHDPTRTDTGADGLPMAEARLADFEEAYRAKIGGTLALGELLDERPGAALTLFGSVNGEFGGSGFGPYAAANAFLVSFAVDSATRLGRTVCCAAWSLWPGTGMSELLVPSAARQRGYLPIDPAAGPALAVDALAAGSPYVLAGLDAGHHAVAGLTDSSCLVPAEVVVAYRGPVDHAAVRAAVESAVAAHHLPVVIREVPALRRNFDGELDRDGIWRSVATADHPSTVDDEPRTELERTTAAVFAELLGRDTVGRDSSFFELGGNSVRAVRVLRELEQRTGVRLSAHELYEYPTVAGTAARIRMTAAIPANQERR